MNSDAPDKNDILLVVGAPRSGTYLLVSRLNWVLPIAIPVETHFMPLFLRWLPLWGDLRTPSRRLKLLEAIYEFLEIWTRLSERGRDWESIQRYSLLCTRPFADRIVEQSGSYADLVRNLYKEYMGLHNAQMAGDKSAFFASVPLEVLAQVVPELKVLHLIRDGRDVSLSWRAMWTGPHSLSESAWLWRDHIRDKQRWGRANSDRYMEVRYEDFLNDTDAALAKISEFVDLPLNEDPQQKNEMARLLAAGETHTMLSGSIDRKNQGKWRNAMSEVDQKLFEFHAGEQLRLNGYPVSKRSFNSIDRLRYGAFEFGARLLTLISWRHWRLRVKAVLPLVIWLFSLVRLNCSSLLNVGKRD